MRAISGSGWGSLKALKQAMRANPNSVICNITA